MSFQCRAAGAQYFRDKQLTDGITKVAQKQKLSWFNQWRHARQYLHLWQLTACTNFASIKFRQAIFTTNRANSRWAIFRTSFWI